MIKILNLKLVTLLVYQNIKILSRNSIFQNDFEGSVIKSKEIVGTFYKMELQKRNQKEFRVEKVFKRKDDKLYLKWKGYENSFNSWIDKKDIL